MKALDKEGLDYLANKVYDAINSGGSADYIVEEGTHGSWYYRKWASGIAECWCRVTMTATKWSAWGNVWEGNPYPVFTFPSGLFNAIPCVTVNVSLNVSGGVMYEMGQVTQSGIGYVIPIRPVSTSNSLQYQYFVQAKGTWKEFTPSVSAKAQVGFEDLTSQVISGSSSFTLVTGSQTQCYRYGNLLYMRVRGTTSSTARNDWISIPLAKIPLTISHQMVGGCSINGNPSYPLISYGDWSGVQYLTQQITNNIPASAVVALWGIFLIKQ